ncbi:DNA helicase II related protein [Fimbriiglobus ruber]|uniref:DNA helicase II related protein n=1 Tax=Fimbriiglobus ruber TaxID=1908690 RepID=A0A225DVE1_9BACT|nr:DNA helicase II related protein [Fimbriiglobus ruber]
MRYNEGVERTDALKQLGAPATVSSTLEGIERCRTIVRSPINIQLPSGQSSDISQAAEAVKQEYRSSVKCKKLRSRDILPTADSSVFRIDLGQSVEFDWTWEGANAFRPKVIDDSRIFQDDFDEEDSAVWFGEVVEVDEAQGVLFVWVSDPDRPPTKGLFYVRPFEFLASLNALYSEPSYSGLRDILPGRLLASRGDVHPAVVAPVSPCLPQLLGVWSHAWSVIWGPPGTGKTTNVGKQVAECLSDPTERLLVISTTNKSTDESAFAVGRAARNRNARSADSGRILRVGKSAHIEAYQANGLEWLLKGAETDLLQQVGVLLKKLHGTAITHERAIFRKQIQQLRRAMKDASFNAFASGDAQVVVATAFKAMTLLNDPEMRDVIAAGSAPFTTVVIDEAGLISRAAVAALSLYASKRVVLAGDSKQLAPISRISRILPTSQATWLASSGLSHLRSLRQTHEAVCLLREQHRMHPHVSTVVSQYQYDGLLEDGATVLKRAYQCAELLAGQPRSLWYVLDDDGDDDPSIRAERGPGNRSWVREKSRLVLKKLFSDQSLRKARGLYITPFVAQSQDIRAFLAEEGIESWSAATVHSQQGTEADIVIFDTVNAGSTAWPLEEWKRLVNVGLSRAREFVILLATRAEMREPYLRSLILDLAPQVLKWSGSRYAWTKVKPDVEYKVPDEIAGNSDLLGNQISTRKLLRPVMSAEQQRLCGYNMDGKPRLVRGVAGSGKTAVMAHWMVKTLRRMKQSDLKIWAVFANQSLSGLIWDTLNDVWTGEGEQGPFPIEQVELWHIGILWNKLNVRMAGDDRFDYNGAAKLHLEKIGHRSLPAMCHAMFIDEAQDMGPYALQLLTRLVVQSDDSNTNTRSVNIFYDNAQNVYGRPTPKWSEMGLDMRGRSFVMQESFRSTKPITEFALNVLYRLQPSEKSGDHGELIDRGLIERIDRSGEEWWNVRFNQTHGPVPIVKLYTEIDAEFDALGGQLISWIVKDGVPPNDICILYNSQTIRIRLESQVDAKLRTVNARLEVQVGKAFTRDANTVVASTAQSFKGYEAEIVVIAGADKFVAKERGILANNLYVAMTRARSVLAVFGYRGSSEGGNRIMSVLKECHTLLTEVPAVQAESSMLDVAEELLRKIGVKHRAWLKSVLKKQTIEQDPIYADDGEVIADPLFWFDQDGIQYACFVEGPKQAIANRLEDAGIKVLLPGAGIE